MIAIQSSHVESKETARARQGREPAWRLSIVIRSRLTSAS